MRSLIWIGRYWRMSEFILSLIVVSVATSLDDLFVAVSLTLRGAPLASLGNLVGANVLNVTLILGEAILLASYAGRRRANIHQRRPAEALEDGPAPIITKIDVLIIFSLTLLPAILVLDGTLSRLDGVLLLLFFSGYVAYLIHQERIVLTAHPYHEFFPGLYNDA